MNIRKRKCEDNGDGGDGDDGGDYDAGLSADEV